MASDSANRAEREQKEAETTAAMEVTAAQLRNAAPALDALARRLKAENRGPTPTEQKLIDIVTVRTRHRLGDMRARLAVLGEDGKLQVFDSTMTDAILRKKT